MTVGIAPASANSALDTLMNTTYIQLHTGDPGAAGTSNVSGFGSSSRPAATFNSASGGSKTITTTLPTWAWTTTDTVTHLTYWTANTAGTFKGSVALTASKSVVSGDTLTLNTLTSAITPLAA